MLLQLEQRTIGWKMYLVAKFSCSGHLVVEFCVSTSLVARASLVISEYWGIMGCKTDEVSVKEAISGFVQVHLQQLFSSESDLSASEEICDASWVFLAEMDGIWVRMKDKTWSVPITLPSVQSFPHHVLRGLSCYHQGFGCFKHVFILRCTVGTLCGVPTFRRQI